MKDRRCVSFLKSTGDPLPPDLSAAVIGRVHWLRDLVTGLDDELGVTFPNVEIAPVCWRRKPGGRDGLIASQMTVGAREDGSSCYVIRVTAPTLLEFPDELLLGVLAHEFLHVVFETLKTYRASKTGTFASTMLVDEAQAAVYRSSPEQYRLPDPMFQVDGRVWLSDRLRRLSAVVEDNAAAVMHEISARIVRTWISRGLPVDDPPLRYQVTGVVHLDPTIIRRAVQLGVI